MKNARRLDRLTTRKTARQGVFRRLLRALDDSCGHVGAFALSALQQIGSPTATQAAMDYLYSQRWDAAIDGERQF